MILRYILDEGYGGFRLLWNQVEGCIRLQENGCLIIETLYSSSSWVPAPFYTCFRVAGANSKAILASILRRLIPRASFRPSDITKLFRVQDQSPPIRSLRSVSPRSHLSPRPFDVANTQSHVHPEPRFGSFDAEQANLFQNWSIT